MINERTPLFHAQNEGRYQRQGLIQAYEAEYDCRLVVMVGEIIPESVTIFEELMIDVGKTMKLHLLLNSPGGDGDAAVRISRAAQARCDEFVVIVPDIAKSAATLLALGAHKILMGPISDLGPVDPQVLVNSRYVAAKDIVRAVEEAAAAVQKQPDTYALYSSLLSDVTMILYREARSTLERGADLLSEALMSCPARSKEAAEELGEKLKPLLIHKPNAHGAIFGARESVGAGLPVDQMDPKCDQWTRIWNIWTRYFILSGEFDICFESVRVSQTFRSAWREEDSRLIARA